MSRNNNLADGVREGGHFFRGIIAIRVVPSNLGSFLDDDRALHPGMIRAGVCESAGLFERECVTLAWADVFGFEGGIIGDNGMVVFVFIQPFHRIADFNRDRRLLKLPLAHGNNDPFVLLRRGFARLALDGDRCTEQEKQSHCCRNKRERLRHGDRLDLIIKTRKSAVR